MRVLVQSGTIAAGLVIAVVIGLWSSQFLVSPNGDASPLIVAAENPIKATLMVLSGLAVISVVGIGLSRFIGPNFGLFVIGTSLTVTNMRMGAFEEFQRLGISRVTASLEAAVWAAILAVLAWVVVHARQTDSQHDDIETLDPNVEPIHARRVIGLFAGLTVLPVVWLIARSELKGQALAAGILSSMMAGMIGKLIVPDERSWVLYSLPPISGIIGYVIVSVFHGNFPLSEIGNGVTPLGVLMPIDYAAGSLIGTAAGISWARSFFHTADDISEVEALQQSD